MSAPLLPNWFWGVRNVVFLAVYSLALLILSDASRFVRMLENLNRSRPRVWPGYLWIRSKRAKMIFRVYAALGVIGGVVFFFSLGGRG